MVGEGARHAVALVLLAGAVAAAAPLSPPGIEEGAGVAGFRAYHYRSDLALPGPGFREVFVVESVDPGFAARSADVEIRDDGRVRQVQWEDADGWVGVGDRFAFDEEATDQQHLLTAHVGGVQVMECRYAGGAGPGFTPDEWRAMGHPEEVRCLPPLNVDQVAAGATTHADGQAADGHGH